ncbi:hypothetical protein [Stenotrophomonas sp. MMGLT7]|uniref:hypothetical protein n=1 Tax=Stenotrophomonas sp. MMGLT7 TaxID=2901227 RepID=UPI001E40602B|nr:hypothetical protein [Stenotrophomonas sp. MMGLT7]MCD7096834.1 hypothetical protein [Stenotrophomonas sp. MMGLT7]
MTVQLVLWTLALAAAIAGLAQVYRLHKRPRAPAPRPWWETPEGVAELSRALRPLWFAAALTVLGALAPRLFRLIGA